MFNEGESDDLDVGFPSGRNEFLSERRTPAMEYNTPAGASNAVPHALQQMESVGKSQRRLSAGRGVARRPSLGSLATGENLARQPSRRDMGGTERRPRRRSRSRDAIGRTGLQRRPSLGSLVDGDATERHRSRSRESIGTGVPQRRPSLGRMRTGRNLRDHVERRPSAGSIDLDGNAGSLETDRRDCFQRQSSLAKMQQTAKEILPLVGWDASDAASSIAERSHDQHKPRQQQFRSSCSNRSVSDLKETNSFAAREKNSDVEGKETACSSKHQSSAVEDGKLVEESLPLIGWGASDAASSSDEEEQGDKNSSDGSDDGTEIYEDFRPRGDFRENITKIPEPKVEEEFDSRRPWRKAPVHPSSHLKRERSENGSIVSFSMDANAAISGERSMTKFETETINEGTWADHAGNRMAGIENSVREDGVESACFEGSELDELEMARAALGRNEFAFGERGIPRANLLKQAHDACQSDPYGNTNPYGTYADANYGYDDLEEAKNRRSSLTRDNSFGHNVANSSDRCDPIHEQPFLGQFYDHPSPRPASIDGKDALQSLKEEVKRPSSTSSSEEEEEGEQRGTEGDCMEIRNDNVETSKVEVDTSLLERVSQPKKEAADSHTTVTAQVYSESAEESGQASYLENDDASNEPTQRPEGVAIETENVGSNQAEAPPTFDAGMTSATQHQQADVLVPPKSDSTRSERHSVKRVAFETEAIEMSSNALMHSSNEVETKDVEEVTRDALDSEGESIGTGLQESEQSDLRRKMMEIAQFGDSGEYSGYNESSPRVAASSGERERSERDWSAYGEQEVSDATLGEKKKSTRGGNNRRLPSAFMQLPSLKSREGKLQRCVGPYVWERRRLFLVGLLLSLVLIAGLAAAFAVVKNNNEGVVSLAITSAPSGNGGGVTQPTLSPYPTHSPSPTQSHLPTHLRSPSSSPTPAPTLPEETSPPPPSIKLLQTLEGTSQSDFAGFSTSFSSDGTYVAIGFKQAIDAESNTGLARVYKLNNGIWSPFGGDLTGFKPGDEFGASLSLSDDGKRLAVGSRSSDDGGPSSGNVRVFQYSAEPGVWQPIGNPIVGVESQDRAGYSVAMSGNGDRVAVGAPRGGDDTGSVRVFDYNGTDWVQIGQELFGDAARVLGGYSCSLSQNGTTLAMSAIRSDRDGMEKNGYVSVFRLSQIMEASPRWQKVGEDILGDNSGDQNGCSVSLSADGSLVAIGANGLDHQGVSNVGYCRVFSNDGSNWTQLGSSMRGREHGEQSGFSISLSRNGNRIACGGANSGVVRVYDYKEDWVKYGELDVSAGSAFGYSVSLTEGGSYLAVGEPEKSINGLPNVGSLNVYMLGK